MIPLEKQPLSSLCEEELLHAEGRPLCITSLTRLKY